MAKRLSLLAVLAVMLGVAAITTASAYSSCTTTCYGNMCTTNCY